MISLELVEGDVVEWDVAAINPLYAMMYPTWVKCRDAKAGGVVIKSKQETYLPKLNKGQDTADYQDYLERAYWYGATGKTVETFVGMIFRKAPNLSIGDSVEGKDIELFKSITSDSKGYEDVIREITEEVLIVNRVGVLEDFPDLMDGEGNVIVISQLEAEEIGLSSNTAIYATESIINWKVEEVDNEKIPVFFMVHETADKDDPKNPLAPDQEDLYRLLYLQPMEDGSLQYRQIVFGIKGKKRGTGKANYEVRKIIIPLQNGKSMNRIPFWIINNNGIEFEMIETPLIYDLVEVNMAHYRNSADYEREIHRVSIKTAVFPGWDDEAGPPEIGGALATPADQTPFILESKSSSPLTEELTKKEQRMATIGAQLLAQKGRYVEAAETAQIQSRGESSVVASVARSIGIVISEIFQFKLKWTGNKSKVSIELNTDFDEARYTAQDLEGLMAMLQGGGISFDVFFYAMDKLEMYPADWTKDKELVALAETEELFGGQNSEEMDSIRETLVDMDTRLNGMTNQPTVPVEEIKVNEPDEPS